MKMQTLRTTLTFGVVALYCAGLYFPSYSTGRGNQNWEGLVNLCTGWLGLLADPLRYNAWLANPLLMVAVFSALWRKDLPYLPILCSALAFASAASFMLVEVILVDEAGGMGTIEARLAGYWCWLAACGLMLVSETIWLLPRNT